MGSRRRLRLGLIIAAVRWHVCPRWYPCPAQNATERREGTFRPDAWAHRGKEFAPSFCRVAFDSDYGRAKNRALEK